jgi:glycerol-3-phosphate acyltransferase PlsY
MPWMQQLQSANWSQASWLALGAYALGCVSTGYYLVKLRTGQDIRDLGSGNAGAKNAGRILGRPGFLLTVLVDVAKGSFAVWVARHFTTDERIVALAMLAVVAGHVWPAQLLFHGGKGFATSLGALMIYNYHLVPPFLLLFAVSFLIVRRTVLPGLFAFACLPLVCMYHDHNSPETVGVSLLAALVLLTHRKNLIDECLHLSRATHRAERTHK